MARVVPFACAALLALAGCNGAKSASSDANKTPAKPALEKLQITDTKPGTGEAAAKGDMLFMRYTGKLADGTTFDSTEKSGGNPFKFRLGSGEVIKGWDEGLVGMKVGGKRTLGIPWNLAYGPDGRAPSIPPKADLYFDVELLDIIKPNEATTIDRKVVKKGTGPAIKLGNTVSVDYVGTLVGGTEFDSTKKRKKPYTFKVGDPKVRPFFNDSVIGMQKGTEFTLRVPPMVGFGPGGFGSVGPNEILNYDVTVKDVR